MDEIGLALSGGGSRAMAFHRGTLGALEEIGATEMIDVVSTVSGGSVFGAAWMSAVADRVSTRAFLKTLVPILERGFVRPALLSPRALKVLLPGRTRTHRLAETFDEILTGGKKLRDLPDHPRLCMNATVLNHAMAARFSRGGFSCDLVGEREDAGSYPEVSLDRTVGFAAAASAAFPFALPPLSLPASDLAPLQGAIRDHRALLLTDGGVLENLGVQLLLRSRRFGTKHVIVSDAGTAQSPWRPTLWGRVASFGAFALTHDTLSRLLTVMNDKQNKSMRQLVLRQVGALEGPDASRDLWFVRIDQTLEKFLRGIPHHHLRAIAGPGVALPPRSASINQVAELLAAHGVDLSRAEDLYRRMGGDAAAFRANGVATNFTGLTPGEIVTLEQHAAWQVYACRAVYGALGRMRGAREMVVA